VGLRTFLPALGTGMLLMFLETEKARAMNFNPVSISSSSHSHSTRNRYYRTSWLGIPVASGDATEPQDVDFCVVVHLKVSPNYDIYLHLWWGADEVSGVMSVSHCHSSWRWWSNILWVTWLLARLWLHLFSSCTIWLCWTDATVTFKVPSWIFSYNLVDMFSNGYHSASKLLPMVCLKDLFMLQEGTTICSI
jgi:hypothetical protein